MYCWGAAFLTFSFVQKYIQIKFFSEFVASAVVISIAAIFTKLGIAQNQDIITIASVMPLVPGILITNAIRDLLAGELLAGMSWRGSCTHCLCDWCRRGNCIITIIRKAVNDVILLISFTISFISTVLFQLYLTP